MSRTSRVRWLCAFWLFVLSAVAFLDRTNISIAGPSIMKEFGWTNQRLGLVFSSFLIGYAGLQLPAGILAVRFGPRLVLTVGVFWWGLVTIATTAVRPGASYALFLVMAARFALGAGEAVIYPAANQFVATWIPQRKRGVINGLIFAGVGAGSGLTPPLLAWIITRHGWRGAFWFSATVGFVAGIVWWMLSRDLPEQHPRVCPGELEEIRAGSSHLVSRDRSDLEPRQAHTHVSWRAILHRPDLAALVVSYFSFGYIAWVFFSWFFVYLTQVRGVDLKASARYSMLPFLCMTVGSLAGGILSDRLTRHWGLRVGRCYLAAASLFATAVFLVLGSHAASARVAGLILAGGAGALYISQSTFWSVSADIAGGSSAVFSSIINIGGQLGGALTASLTPLIAQHAGWTWSFGTAAALGTIGALCWLSVHPERPLDVVT